MRMRKRHSLDQAEPRRPGAAWRLFFGNHYYIVTKKTRFKFNGGAVLPQNCEGVTLSQRAEVILRVVCSLLFLPLQKLPK